MDIDFPSQVVEAFRTKLGTVPTVINDLAAADLVVFDCIHGQSRSPATMVTYQNAMQLRQDRNPNQLVVLLEKGMTECIKLDTDSTTSQCIALCDESS